MPLRKATDKQKRRNTGKTSTAKDGTTFGYSDRLGVNNDQSSDLSETEKVHERESEVRNDEGSVEDTKELQRYKKNHLPTHGKLTLKHVKDVLFHLHHNVESNIRFQMKKCEELKKKIFDWARGQIQEMMLKEAIAQDICIKGKTISKFTQIGDAYSQDGSEEMHNKIHAVIYQQFKQRPGWRNELEQEFMEQNEMCYDDEENKASGFVKVLITEVYGEQKRGITDRAKKSHGTFVRLRKQPKKKKKSHKDEGSIAQSDQETDDSDDEESSVEEKAPKRRKGIFHSSYIRVEKNTIQHKGGSWMGSPKSRQMSSREREDHAELQQAYSDLQAKLICVMEQNIKLRSALTAHSIAIPEDLQEEENVKDTLTTRKRGRTELHGDDISVMGRAVGKAYGESESEEEEQFVFQQGDDSSNATDDQRKPAARKSAQKTTVDIVEKQRNTSAREAVLSSSKKGTKKAKNDGGSAHQQRESEVGTSQKRNTSYTPPQTYGTITKKRPTVREKTPRKQTSTKPDETPKVTLKHNKSGKPAPASSRKPTQNDEKTKQRKAVGERTPRKPAQEAPVITDQTSNKEDETANNDNRTSTVASTSKKQNTSRNNARKTVGQKEPRNPQYAQMLLTKQLRADAPTNANEAEQEAKDVAWMNSLYESSEDDDGCFNFSSNPYSAGNIIHRMGKPNIFDSDESSGADLPMDNNEELATVGGQTNDETALQQGTTRMQVGAKSPRGGVDAIERLKQRIRDRKGVLDECDSSATLTDMGSLNSWSNDRKHDQGEQTEGIGEYNSAGSTISVPEHDGSAISIPQARSKKTAEKKSKKGSTTPKTKNKPAKKREQSKRKDASGKEGDTERKTTKTRKKTKQPAQTATTELHVNPTTEDVANNNETCDVFPTDTAVEMPTKDGCDYNHDDYDIGTMYYVIEDPKELLFVLNGLRCKLCDIAYGKKQGEWKPGAKTPVYACRGMRCGEPTCEWAVCGNCFGKEQMKRVDETTSVRTRRRT